MKKWMKICLILLCVVLCVVFLRELFAWKTGRRIDPSAVVNIELEAYGYSYLGKVVLSQQEAKKVISMFNRSKLGGEVNAEPGSPSYTLWVYLEDGTKLSISKGARDKMKISTSDYFVVNQKLINYIKELADQYNVPRWEMEHS